MAAGSGARARCAAGSGLPGHPMVRMGEPAVRTIVDTLLFPLFRHHWLSYGSCGGRDFNPACPDLVVETGLFQQPPLCPHPYRCALLAFRRRGLDRGVLYFLRHAAAGAESMSTALDPGGPAPETREPRFLWLLFGC